MTGSERTFEIGDKLSDAKKCLNSLLLSKINYRLSHIPL